jgi:hypothetical protein
MCVLRVTGSPSFDVDGYLLESSLKPGKIFRAGTPRLPKSQPDGPTHSSSGFNVDVSNGDLSNLSEQIRDACAFLALHQPELVALSLLPSVRDLRLDFPIELRVGRSDVVVQSEFFPATLVEAAGRAGIGLELSIYPVSDGDQDEQHPVATDAEA